jgi:peptidoglycan/LPS O-acetylase OafA/YrhL
MRFEGADGLRGLAVCMVVAGHAVYFNPQGPEIYKQIQRVTALGVLGVPIFFALSGFLLSLPFFRGREQDPAFWYHRGFVLRRVLKIIPPFYLVTLGLACFWYARTGERHYFKIGLAWATGLAHFKPRPPLNGSFWSLWVEIGFYAMLPLLFFTVRARNIRAAGWIMFAILMGTSFFSRCISLTGLPRPDWFFLSVRFPNSLDSFAWGVLFAAYYPGMSREPERWRHLARMSYLGMIWLLCGSFALEFHTIYAHASQTERMDVELTQLVRGTGSFLILFFIFDSECWMTRFFASPAMRFLGAVSFEWFLIHQPVLNGARALAVSAHGSLPRYFVIILIPVLVTLGVSTLLYYYFSLPILRWGRDTVAKGGNRGQERPVKSVKTSLA